MKIQIISREEIVNRYLDMMLEGYKLNNEDIELLKDMVDGKSN